MSFNRPSLRSNSSYGKIPPRGLPSTPPPIRRQSSFTGSTKGREGGTPTPQTSNINLDHVSILACYQTPNGNEYFLAMHQLSLTYGLVGTRPIAPTESWKGVADKILMDARIPIKAEGIIRMDRWFVPGSERMSSHVVYLALAKTIHKKHFSNAFVGAWMGLTQIRELNREQKLICPDILDIIANSSIGGAAGIQTAVHNELTLDDFINFGSGEDQSQGTKKKSGFEVIVKAAEYGQHEQELIYKDFMSFAVPYFTIGKVTFGQFMERLGWNESIVYLFKAFDIQNRGGLSYRDILFGLAAIEPSTPHGGPPAEIRCRYIFRYYDRNGDGKLDFEEFRRIVADIRSSRGLPLDLPTIDQEAVLSAKSFGSNSNSLGLVDFLTGVGQLKFRGTSNLLRAPRPIVPLLLGNHGQQQPNPTDPVRPALKKSMTGTVFEADGVVAQNLFEEYDIAAHSVRIRKSGTILDIHSLWDIEHSGISGEAQHSRHMIGPNTDVTRILSFDSFNQDTQHNEMLNGLKFFQREISKDGNSANNGLFHPKPAFDWGEVDRNSLSKCVISLCNQVREIMSNEPRLLEIPAPCYILGDIHGNFPDLVSFEKALWRLGPVLTPSSFLFLGDYVDRGDFGVEVVSYLFAQKIIAPHKFHLLRGNHEIREVQQMFTFFKECIQKFGEKTGRDVWESVNSAFDCMPLAAIVDKKVFCAHGGIPPPWIGDGLVGVINTIPCPLPQPERSSPLSWELMWSDPLHLELLTPEQKGLMVLKQGFGPNLRRGTGHVFNEEALNIFLAKNGLSHVIRAHEVQQAGFQVQLKGRLLTVFSSSKYCGGSNEAACILADKFKLRTIRIDTS